MKASRSPSDLRAVVENEAGQLDHMIWVMTESHWKNLRGKEYDLMHPFKLYFQIFQSFKNSTKKYL